ncbi:MAG: hypothetical protein P8075_21295 [Deltaproteobacteria bacterium]|jgi:hypothetical protein
MMKKEVIQYVTCAHCGARVHMKDAVQFKSVFISGEHYHCKEYDPTDRWDCTIDDVPMHYEDCEPVIQSAGEHLRLVDSREP